MSQWGRDKHGARQWFMLLQMKRWGFLTVCMPGQPSKGYLKPPWRDVGWPLVGYCHLFYLKRCSSRWMKTECHRELLLFLHDLSGHMITGLETVKTYVGRHFFNFGWRNCSSNKNVNVRTRCMTHYCTNSHRLAQMLAHHNYIFFI